MYEKVKCRRKVQRSYLVFSQCKEDKTEFAAFKHCLFPVTHMCRHCCFRLALWIPFLSLSRSSSWRAFFLFMPLSCLQWRKERENVKNRGHNYSVTGQNGIRKKLQTKNYPHIVTEVSNTRENNDVLWYVFLVSSNRSFLTTFLWYLRHWTK